MRTRAATLPEWVRAELRRREISGRAAAREADVGVSVVQNLLAHGSIPKDENLRKLATWAGVPFSYLRDMAHPAPEDAPTPQPAIRYLSSVTQDELYTRLDTARAKLAPATLQWLDPWLDERAIVGLERLSHYELAAQFAGGGGDATRTNHQAGPRQYRSCPAELGDLPPR